MSIIGKVDSVWRYPVKSMRGEELDEAFAGFSGIYGDRLFAFRSSASPKGFPYFTAREQRRLLQYRPHFRYPEKAALPINLADADKMGANPVSADPGRRVWERVSLEALRRPMAPVALQALSRWACRVLGAPGAP